MLNTLKRLFNIILSVVVYTLIAIVIELSLLVVFHLLFRDLTTAAICTLTSICTFTYAIDHKQKLYTGLDNKINK
jgi:hypothetical protein